ncbi:Ig-like domain-containing protein [uncultured Draconibacterium sp.]|uniref:Ig-like domain-containing protein n=1 Tax=uncultured Draconibacterium sp. TaxID=1573823 RepID=UPI0025FC19A7|nr:Ig-like domain-containing protein [uncultured Draconibacterium sp.]
MYIVIFLLMAANVLAQETYVIDSVCVGATRTYRIDGEEGDTYEWNIYRLPDSSLYASEVPYLDFMDLDRPAVGDTTYGSEIDQLWDDEGEFDVWVLHWSVHGCDTFEVGRVKVFPTPGAMAGPDQVVCSMEDIVLTADTAWNHSSLFWTSTGDGTFSDSTALHPTYYLGPTDSLAGSVQLIITAYGLADNITCEPAIDTVEYLFSNPDIAFVVTDLLCYGDSSAAIKANITDGIAPYNFSWTGPNGLSATSDSIGDLGAGMYYLTVTDANGCTDFDSVEIISPPEILVAIDSTKDISCYGGSDGFIWAHGSGGTGALTFEWLGYSGYTATGDTVYNLPADTFLLTVTDENLCTVFDTVILTEPEPMLAEIDSVIGILCYGDESGAAHVEVSGGTPPYAIVWNTTPVQDSVWANNLGPGEYIVTVTDANNCSAADTVIIDEPLELLVNIDSIKHVSCYGGSDGLIFASASGGTDTLTFEWTGFSGYTATGDSVFNLPADTFLLTVTDVNGCVVNDTVVITEPDPLIADIDSIIDILCYGDSSGAAHVAVIGGTAPYLIEWNTIPVQDSAWVRNLGPGEYVVTVTDANNCTASDTVIINEPLELLVDIDSVHHISCYGGTDGFILSSATGGTGALSFEWAGYNTGTYSGDSVYNLPADTFLLTVTDANGCFVNDTVIIVEPEPLYTLIDSIIDVQCYEYDNGAAHVAVFGGTAPFTYEWDNNPAMDSAWAVNLAPGQHTVIITDANNCLAYDTVDITEPLPIVLSADSIDVRCGGKKPGEIDLHVSGGTPFANAPYYLFEWTDSTGNVFATTEDVDSLAGDQLYTVWVTDSLGCTAFHQVYINEIKNIRLSAVVDTAQCYGDTWSIYLTVERGRKPYSYLWTDTLGNVLSTDEDLPNVGPGIYWVTVNDKDSCDESLQFVFEPLEELLADITADDSIACENDVILLAGNPSGGTGELTHLWTGAGAVYLDRTDSSDVIFSGAAAGNYQLIYTVIDANACTTSDSIELRIEPPIQDTIYVSLCANELPFNWLGNFYDAAGQYIDTIPGEIGVGCDTIRMLDLFIEPMEEDTIYVSLCANELPFTWNGNFYDAAGQYIDTIPGEIGVGCDTIRMLDLFIEPMEEDTIYVSLCANELPFNWLGNFYDAAGQYIDTIPGEIGVGCDTIRMLDLFIEPMEEDTIYVSLCANELPFTWNGNFYDAAGQYIDTIPGEIGVGCDTIRMLDLYIEPMEEDTIYASICANELPFDWNGNFYDAGGQYVDTVPGEIGVGCDTIRVLDLFIEPLEEDTMYLSLCTDELPYNWIGNTVTAAGEYQDTIPGIIGLGCDTLLTLYVEVHEPDTVVLDTVLCQGAPTYPWNGHTVLTDQDSSYEAVLVNRFGCDSLLTLNVIIIPPSYTTETMTLCLGDPAVPWNGFDLVSTNDSTYTATLKTSEGCDSVVTMEVSILYPTYSDELTEVCENEPAFDWNGNTILTDRDGVYNATLVNAVGCDSILTLTVQSNPVSTFEMDTVLCVGAPSFIWNGQTITSARDDSYQVTLQNQFNCDSLVTLNVFVIPPDTTYLDTTLCEGDAPFAWYSNTIQTNFSDQYETRLNNRYNCDSLLIFNVEILPITDTIIDTMLCYETPAFAWNNLMVYALNDSTYRDTLVGANQFGCDSVLTLNVSIVYPDTVTIDTTICEGEPDFAWGVNTINQVDAYTDSIYTDVLTNQYGCDSIVYLDVEILRPTYILDTIEICENEPAFTWHSINILTDRDSIYTDTLYYQQGCDSLRLELTLISHPLTDTLLDTILCEGSPEFAWNNVWIQTDFSQVYFDTLPGANQYGCDSLLTYDVTILPAMKDTLTNSICYGDPVADWYGISISNETDSVYIYNAPGPSGCDTLIYYEVTVLPVTDSVLYLTLCYGAPDTTINNVTITSDQSWIYFDTIPNFYNCDSLLTYNVTILPPDTVRMDTVLCVGDPEYDWNGYTVSTTVENVYEATLKTDLGCDSIVILTTTLIDGGVTYDTVYACVEYTWTDGTGLTYTETGDDFRVLGTGSACPDTAWLHVVISDPVIMADSVNVLCYGDSTGSIDIEVSGGIEPYTYSWSNGEITEDLTNLPAGVYTVTVTDALSDTLGCSATLTVTIEQPEELEIILVSVTDVLVMGDSTGSIDVSVIGGTPTYDYAWTNEAGDTIGINEDLFNQAAGDYTLAVTDANECVASITVSITEPVPLDKYMSPVVTEICYEERFSYPLLDSLLAYLALHPDVEVFSNAGIDTSTFTVDTVVYVGVNYCYEEIRTYRVLDFDGDTLSATHQIIVDDQIDPVLNCPPDLTVGYGFAPDPAADTSEFLAMGGSFSDNCAVVSFRHVSDVSDGGTDPETITRTYEVGDFCGNTTQCTQIIYVYQAAEFVLECPNLSGYTFECEPEVPRYTSLAAFEAAGGVAYSNPVALDPSSFRSTISSSGSCPKTITITYFIRNVNGEETSCIQVFKVDDTIRPDLEFKEITLGCNDPLPRVYEDIYEVRAAGDIADDNCQDRFLTLTLMVTDQFGTCPTTYTRTYRLTDGCGNYRQATQYIYKNDTIPPVVLATPNDLNADCYMPGPYADYAEFRADGGLVDDDCGDFVMTYEGDSAASPGIVFRTYRFTDECDNYTDYIQQITVIDSIPPLIGIPDTTLVCDPVEITTIEVFLSFRGWFSDNCEIDSSSFKLISSITYDSVCPRRYINTYEIYDMSGNRGETTHTITVVDDEKPLLFCPPDDTIDATAAYPDPYVVLSEFISGGGSASDNCEIDSSSFTLVSLDSLVSDCEGQMTYTYIVADECGNWSETCSYTIFKRDESNPVLTCPADISVECFDDVNARIFTSLADFVAAGGTATDNYELLESSFRHVGDSLNGTTCPLIIVRTYSIEDICGNIAQCSYSITINDITPPVIICPSDTAIECLSEVLHDITTIEAFEAAGGVLTDNCEIDPNSFTFRSEKQYALGSTTITNYYSIADLCGNVDSCQQVITLTDTIPPVPVCNSITVYLDDEGNYIMTEIDIATIANGSSDNCTAAEDLIIDVDISDFTCLDVEEGRQVNVVVTDEAGNSGVCVADIIIGDNIPPTAICQNITVYLDDTGIATITPDMIDNGSFDNCGIETYQITPDEFDCFDVGDNLVTLIVTDYYGLRDTCEAIVTVIDPVDPFIECRPLQTIQLDEYGKYELSWDMVTDTVSDECGIDTVLLDDYELDCDNIGITTITVTAYDVNGNSSTCEATFEVFGNLPPNVVNDSAVTAVNVPVEIPVTNNDYDLKTNINLESLGVVIAPSHGSVVVDNNTGMVTYTPDLDYEGPDIFRYQICDDGIPCEPECGQAIVFIMVRPANNPPIAVDDYYEVPCGDLFGNVILNDSDPDGDDISVNPVPVTPPDSGALTLYSNGNFEYIPFEGFFGIDSFQYVICDNGIPSLCDTAWVYITRVPDNDCDGIPDTDDIDDDNDGIIDIVEGDRAIDSDHDGIPDSYDIDSDNDGIPDNIEGQAEGNYIPPTGRDGNGNGWDDAYDPENGGYPFTPEDTDGDSMPDYLDIDSDNDGVFDMIEGHDDDNNGIADVLRWYSDEDRDGLDDAYDTYSGWADYGNETGSNAPIQDFDGDGIRDWRDTNDEDDQYPTVNEDLNGDGDYSNDDLDLDGYPEYLDTELNCELFIPDGFSPNDDGVHDFFQILCIQKYPNAKLMIFNRNGVKLWEKEHYGNLDVWGTYEDAWWWGTSENILTIGKSGGLPAGNYIYVLILNDGLGTVKNGTVMLAY